MACLGALKRRIKPAQARVKANVNEWMWASLRHPALLALFCKVFCGAKPCGVQPRKHASKPSTNNLKNTGRCEENRKWRQRKIWPTGYGRCSRCRHLASHKSVTKSPRADLFLTCVHLCRIVSSDLGEGNHFLQGRVQVWLFKRLRKIRRDAVGKTNVLWTGQKWIN